jgi:hypothetical protein
MIDFCHPCNGKRHISGLLRGLGPGIQVQEEEKGQHRLENMVHTLSKELNGNI